MSDRKYRQSGYQDSDRAREKPRAQPSGPKTQDPAKGPRGRGLGAPTASVFRCAACGKKLELADPVALDATCPHCRADLHTCTHCVSFDSGARNECRLGGATLPDGKTEVRIAKKRHRNECTLFAPRTTQEFAKEETRAPDDPRAAFDALFK